MDNSNEAGTMALLLAGTFAMLFGIAIYLFFGFCMGRIFRKAGRPMIAGFVPIWNVIVLLEIIGRPMWWLAVLIGANIVSMFVPFIGWLAPIAVWVVLALDLAKSFGASAVAGIFFPILAFSNDQYRGPAADPNATL